MSDRELEVAAVVNETLETMIIAPSESLSFHGSMISAETTRATHSRDVWDDVANAMFRKSRRRCMMTVFRAQKS